jgi:16S rRNA (adenine1518-N6/adenine1519-N6)-dimethyltransferase
MILAQLRCASYYEWVLGARIFVSATNVPVYFPLQRGSNVPKVASTRRPQSKPKLGQHFLASEDATARIVDALGDVSQSTVLEIGPGRGMLTAPLARRSRRLIAVELDRVLAAQLRLQFGMTRNVEVIEGDILSIDIDSLFGPKPGLSRPGIDLKPQPAKVVGNLPYYITSDILLRLFSFSKYFDSIVIMVQREVADRIAAEPGGRDYGMLSVTAQLYARVENLFTLPPEAFVPPPKVHSSVLRLTIDPQQEKLGVAGDGFIDFLRLSFGQKRKTLWNNLKAKYEGAVLKQALAEAGVKGTARAETLSLAQSAAIFRALQGANNS